MILKVEEDGSLRRLVVVFTISKFASRSRTVTCFFRDTDVHECRVSERARSKETFDVNIRGRSYAVTIVDPKRLRSGQNSDRHHHGVAEILAPMPGKVVRVQIEAGARVEKGAGMVVVEAMKMQNEMKSPRAGVVVSINVKPGDTVNAGDVLAVVE